MDEVRQSQAGADGAVFGYLGVRIRGTDVWTLADQTPSHYLGPLKGAIAGLAEPGRTWLGTFISNALLGDAPPKNPRLYIVFAGRTRYERLALPWVRSLDWPKVAGEIGRFNAAAELANRGRPETNGEE